jgi:hypothetical protein
MWQPLESGIDYQRNPPLLELVCANVCARKECGGACRARASREEGAMYEFLGVSPLLCASSLGLTCNLQQPRPSCLAPSTMTSNSRKLPPELWLEIARSMSCGDLRQLRCVDTTLNILMTPLLFESITILNSNESARGFWDLLHTHHIARHVQSITFLEGTFEY